MLRSYDSAFSSGLPLSRLAALAVSLTAAALGLGCTPQIGDDCSVSTNCSTTGVRLCDITQPGGYCTIFNCEPGSCPDDSKCVNFGTKLSLKPDATACIPSQANSPYKRSFCMASCSKDSDCRNGDGYRCFAPSEFHAVLAEHESGAKVCAVPPTPAPTTPSVDDPRGTLNEVCIGSDAGPADDSSSASGGGAGASGGGASGAGTSGGGDGGDGS